MRLLAPCLPYFSGVDFDVLHVDLDADGGWDLSYIPTSGVINVCSSLQSDFLLIQEKCNRLLINPPSNAGDVFELVLRGLTISTSNGSSCPALTGCHFMSMSWLRPCTRLSFKL